jgi:hypothetical protein
MNNNETEESTIERRRTHIYQNAGPASRWGLALSGGGIRSATFCLGVLQALAKAKFSVPTEPNAKNDEPLLARFDYLSTVSGGGYVGGFYSALFRVRKDENATPESKAKDAYAALKIDPPGRFDEGQIRSVTPNPADTPLRWLRENGRYLAPADSGDLFTDVAIAIRNFCAVHYVIGFSLLTIFLLMFGFRYLTLLTPDSISSIVMAIEVLTQPTDKFATLAIWWSPWFVMLGGWIVIGLMPLGVAYWFEQGKPPAAKSSPTLFTKPFVFAAGLLLAGVATIAYMNIPFNEILSSPRQHGVAILLCLFVIVLAIALIEFLYLKIKAKGITPQFRYSVTHALTQALWISVVLFSIAAIETAGQSLYLWLIVSATSSAQTVGLVASVVAIIAAIRQFAPSLIAPAKDGFFSKLPLNVILGAVGLPLLIALLILWHLIATAILFNGAMPNASASNSWLYVHLQSHTLTFVMVLVFCFFATIAAGYFLGFINLSGLQTMYSARLRRAYLGASNYQRFDQANAKLNVTVPDENDDFSTEAYFDKPHLGPAHIINVTINATTGSSGQLTQRDRQGIPMAITPSGYSLNGTPWVNRDAAPLTIGQWIGISGAAFSTGIGRGTGLGTALIFGLTNIRLGWWWDSGKTRLKKVLPVLRNQAYLLREFRARFFGTDDSHWYLSDGGHYENTGVLELLRRHVKFIVCCDCGADPNYTFEDLANLIRIARIDFAADFTLVPPIDCDVFQPNSAALADYFVADEHELFAKVAGTDNKCLMLYRVTFENSKDFCHVLIIKPRLIKDAPLDLFEYQIKNKSFPQQTTFDQFFDEAQWESYRKLGVLIGSAVFK